MRQHIKGQSGPASISRGANLDENRQAVVGITRRIQVVLVFLGDVRHQHVHQSLHGVVEGCRETLVPGQLDQRKQKIKGLEGKGWRRRRLDLKHDLL